MKSDNNRAKLIVMRKVYIKIFVTVALLMTAVSGVAQNVTKSFRNVPLSEIIKELERIARDCKKR